MQWKRSQQGFFEVRKAQDGRAVQALRDADQGGGGLRRLPFRRPGREIRLGYIGIERWAKDDFRALAVAGWMNIFVNLSWA